MFVKNLKLLITLEFIEKIFFFLSSFILFCFLSIILIVLPFYSSFLLFLERVTGLLLVILCFVSTLWNLAPILFFKANFHILKSIFSWLAISTSIIKFLGSFSTAALFFLIFIHHQILNFRIFSINYRLSEIQSLSSFMNIYDLLSFYPHHFFFFD